MVLSKREKDSKAQKAVGIVTTSMTLSGSSKPTFYKRLSRESPPTVRIEATKASVATPFPPIRPESIHVQWYGDEYVQQVGSEKEEVIRKPVERGWGIWYQADVIAKRLRERQRQSVKRRNYWCRGGSEGS